MIDTHPGSPRDGLSARPLATFFYDVAVVTAYAHLLWRSGLTGIIVQPTLKPLAVRQKYSNQNTQLQLV